jgi:hypothetical protein
MYDELNSEYVSNNKISKYGAYSENICAQGRYNVFTHTTFLWVTCCLMCFILVVKPFLTLILTVVRTVYLIWK